MCVEISCSVLILGTSEGRNKNATYNVKRDKRFSPKNSNTVPLKFTLDVFSSQQQSFVLNPIVVINTALLQMQCIFMMYFHRSCWLHRQ
jgi:hypothetical protein